MLGREYVIDHCIATIKHKREELAYRVYITDALKAIADNGTHHVTPGVGSADYGTSIKTRWADLIKPAEPMKKTQEDTRTCTEIATDIWSRIRGKGGE